MEAAALVSDPLPKLALLLAAASAASVLLSTGERRRAWSMALTLALALAILIGHIQDTEQFRSISASAGRLALAGAGGAAVVACLAWLFSAYPGAFAPAAIAALPFRVPIAAAGSTVNLLVPLYAVIAGGCLAYLWKSLHARDEPPPQRSRSLLELALAAFIVLYTLQALYSRDFDTALEQLVFFGLPFVVLFRLLCQVKWSRPVVAACLGVVVAEAVVFSLIGFWEYERRELFWNPKVIASNQFDSFFRVNSVFWDPNIFGRFLVLAMILLSALMLWTERTRLALASAAVLAVLWGGLVLTFSQSSFVSLLAGLAVLAALRWDVRRAAVAASATLALALVLVFSLQGPLDIQLSSSAGFNKFSSGRGNLISGGLELFAARPLWGYGSGAFGRAYRTEQHGNQQESVSASHTQPVTVATEQGVAGLAAYLLVVGSGLALLFGDGRYRAAGSERGPPSDGRGFVAARAAVAACFVALLIHTLAYAAFLEDPLSWVLLATGLAFAPRAALAGRSEAERSPGRPSRHEPAIPLAESR